MRTDGWLYRLLVALSGMTLIFVVVYIVLIQDNRSVQAEVNQRQQFISQSIQLGRISDALIRALATTAVSNKDDKLRDLLAQNGITINPTTGAPEREAAPVAAAPATARTIIMALGQQRGQVLDGLWLPVILVVLSLFLLLLRVRDWPGDP